MRKGLIILISILFMITPSLYAFNVPGDITFFGLEKMSQAVKNTVFSIQFQNNEGEFVSVGTGFLLSKGNRIFGITCYHVIEGFLEKKKEIYFGLNTNIGFNRFKARIRGLDKDNDIALLSIIKGSDETMKLKNLVLNEKYLSEQTNLKEGRAVLIPGYPLGIGTKHDSNNPVIRFGIIAQHSEEDIFLIDGVANPGNSGSPVFDIKEAKFIGMVTSYKSDFINLFNQNGELVAKFPYNSGLSSAVSSQLIDKALDKYK